MKKRTRYLFVTLMTLTCLTTMLMSVCAAGTTSVSLPVTVNLSDPLPSKAEDFRIMLTAVDAANPMPEGSVDGKYTLTVSGQDKTNTDTFPAITFDRVGIYDYTVTQIEGINKKCTYDTRVYYARIYITNSKDMTALEPTMVIYTENPDTDDKQAEKADTLVFANKYAKTTTDSPKTGDESQPLLYAGLIAASLAVLVALLVTRNPTYFDEE